MTWPSEMSAYGTSPRTSAAPPQFASATEIPSSSSNRQGCARHLGHLHHLLPPETLRTVGRPSTSYWCRSTAATMAQAAMLEVPKKLRARIAARRALFAGDACPLHRRGQRRFSGGNGGLACGGTVGGGAAGTSEVSGAAWGIDGAPARGKSQSRRGTRSRSPGATRQTPALEEGVGSWLPRGARSVNKVAKL